MGQYWAVVNLTKRETIDHYRLGHGAKLWEHVANHPGTGAALLVLCANQVEQRGGGDLDLDENWHGPERTFPAHNASPGPMPGDYAEVARRTIGRWAGDKIALIGGYAKAGDLGKRLPKGLGLTEPDIYDAARSPSGGPKGFTDITDDVVAVLAHELKLKVTKGRDGKTILGT